MISGKVERKAHLVGVAGVGMSPLAQALLHAGYDVSGSDRLLDSGESAEVLAALKSAGVRVFPQDGSGVRPGAELVVSTAIESGNPDLVAAGRQGCPTVHRAVMLARLCEGRRCVAVTGTSGKSTVTGMVGVIMEHAGLDPTVVNGACVLNWRGPGRMGNMRGGKSDWWVIEADESDRSLLNYNPEWAVVTNMSADHFDMEDTRALFAAFRAKVKAGVVGDTGGGDPYEGFGFGRTAFGSSVSIGGAEYEVHVPGRHNAENAFMAVHLCLRLGIAPGPVRAGLATFRGIHRRLEKVGEERGVLVIDDYAHNPAKIAAAWETAAAGRRRVFALWRPHGFGPLAKMKADLAAVFGRLCGPEDRIWLLPVYDAGGTADRTIRPECVMDLMAASCADRVSVAEPAVAAAMAADEARDGDVVLVMGARDPGLPSLCREILRRIAARI